MVALQDDLEPLHRDFEALHHEDDSRKPCPLTSLMKERTYGQQHVRVASGFNRLNDHQIEAPRYIAEFENQLTRENG